MSAVSENINTTLDAPFGDNPELSFFKTAARGIEKELSWGLTTRDVARSVSLLGLGFDLKEYHPCLLFFAPLPFSREEVKDRVVKKRGTERKERNGLPKFASLEDEGELNAMLQSGDWFPSGMASVMRTLEYLDCVAQHRSMSRSDVAKALSLESDWFRGGVR